MGETKESRRRDRLDMGFISIDIFQRKTTFAFAEWAEEEKIEG